MNKSQQKRNIRFYADVFVKKIRETFDNVKANNKKYKTILIEFQDALKEIAKLRESAKEDFGNKINNYSHNNDRIHIYNVDVVFEYFVDVIRQVWREAYLLDQKNKGNVEIQKNLLRLDSICMGVAEEMVMNEIPLEEAANPYQQDDESDEDDDNSNGDDESEEDDNLNKVKDHDNQDDIGAIEDVIKKTNVERSSEYIEDDNEQEDGFEEELGVGHHTKLDVVANNHEINSYIQKDLESDDDSSSSVSSIQEDAHNKPKHSEVTVNVVHPIKTVNVSEYESSLSASSESEIEQDHDEYDNSVICSDSDNDDKIDCNDAINLDKDIKVVTINQKLVKQKKYIKKKLLETTKDNKNKERECDHHKSRHSHSFF